MVLDTCIEKINCTDEIITYGDLPGYMASIQECNKSLQTAVNKLTEALERCKQVCVATGHCSEVLAANEALIEYGTQK